MPDSQYEVNLLLTATNQVSGAAQAATRDLGRIDDGVKKVEQSGGVLERSMRRVQQSLELGIAGAALQKVGDIAAQMYELGSRVNVASAYFEQFAGELGDTQQILQTLREATGGAASDFELMGSASQILRLGIVNTKEDLSELIFYISRLKDPTVEMGDAIRDFSLLIANQSTMRLDQFGLSAANVSERVTELKDAGLSASDAFRQATFEEMARSVENLGGAADAAITPVAQLAADVENLKAAFSGNFAQGLNGLIGGIRDLGAATAEVGANNQAAANEAYARGMVIGQQFLSGYETALDPAVIGMVIEEAMRALQQDPAANLLDPAVFTSFLPFGDLTDFTEEQWQQYAGLLGFIEDQNALMEQAAALNQRNLDIEEARVAAASALSDYRQGEIAFANQYAAEQERAARVAGIMDPAVAANQQLFGLVNPAGRGSIGGDTLFTPDELAQAEQLARTYEQALEYATTMHEQGVISDEQLDYLTRGADEVERMRDAARAGAEAFQQISLSQAFGEGANATNLGTDLSSQFLNFMQGMDLSDADFGKLSDTILLASGQVTEASIVFRDQVLPLVQAIFEDQGAGAAATALANLEQFLSDAALQGLTPEQIALMLPGQTGFVQTGGGGGGQIIVKQGDTPSRIAAQYGMTLPEVYAAIGTNNPYAMLPGTYGVGGGQYAPADAFGNAAIYGFAPLIPGIGDAAGTGLMDASDPLKAMSDSSQKIADDLEGVSATLEAIDSKHYAVKMDLQATAPAWLIRLLNMNGGSEFLEAIVSDNGGSTPGENPRSTRRPDAL